MFLDTINMINVKLCMMVVHIRLYPFVPFQWPWWYNFKVRAVSNSFNGKFYVLMWLSWNFVQVLITSSRSWTYHYFWFLHMFKGNNWHISSFQNTYNVAFFLDTIEVRCFKLCIIITLLEIYISNVCLMTLTLFQGHRYVRNIMNRFCFLDSCLESCLL